MAEIIGFDVVVNSDKAGQSVGSLKQQLREAQADVQALSDKFGAASEQAVAAAKKAAELKDRIGDAKALTDAFNPDRKFQAFSAALQGVVGGISAFQGAMGLLGVKNEEVEQTLLKVQSAMALSQGINSVLEARDSFKNLGTVIQSTAVFQKANNAATTIAIALQKAFGAATIGTGNAFKILKAVIASSGIGLLIIGISTAIEKISSWIGSTENAKQANERLNQAIEQQNRLFDINREKLRQAKEDAIIEAKIKGASAEQIFQISKEFGQKDIALSQDNFNKKKKILSDFESQNLEVFYRNGERRVRGTQENLDQYNKLVKEFNDADATLRSSQRQLVVDDQNERLRIADQGRANAKQAISKQNQLNDQARQQQKQIREKAIQDEKDLNKQLSDLQNENFLKSIKDDTQRALVKLSQDRENKINEINQSTATQKTKNKLLIELDNQFQLEKDAIEEEARIKREEKERDEAEKAAQKLRDRIDIENSIRVAGIKDEFEKKKAELLLQQEAEEADLAKKRADNYFSEEAYQQGLRNIKDKYDKLNADIYIERDAAIRQYTYTSRELELYNLNEQYKKKLALVKGNEEAELAVTKEYEDKKRALKQASVDQALEITKQSLSNISNIVGKETAAGKAIAITSATIDTYQAANKALKADYGVFGPAAQVARFIAVAATIGAGIKNVKEIAKAKIPGAAGGGVNVPSSVTSAAPIAPATPGATLTQLDQGTINRLGSATNRAYVLETDVTNSQERIRRINRAARLN